MVIIGIPANDDLLLPAGAVRRKGLTIRLCRRMKHTYPRAIAMTASGALDLSPLITHHRPLDKGAEAYDLAHNYADGVIKAIIHVTE